MYFTSVFIKYYYVHFIKFNLFLRIFYTKEKKSYMPFLFMGKKFLQACYKIKAYKIHDLFLPYQENKTTEYQRNSFPSTLFKEFFFLFFVKALFICIYLFEKRTHSSSCLD